MALALAERVAEALGLALLELSPLAEGASGQVFRLEAAQGTFVLRTAQPHPGKRPGFASDARIRTELLKLDERTARPLAHSGTHPEVAEIAWCLDSFVAGESPSRGQAPPQLGREVGEVLAHLHSLDAAGYGLLDETSEQLRGCCHDALEGIRSRLQDPWPFTDEGLERHPLMAVAPHIAPVLAGLREETLAVASVDAVVCHTDLHERQLVMQGGRLRALLDFGDAALGPPAWDLASFGYFHGWRQLAEVMKGYGDTRKDTLEQAQHFSLVIAFHHLSRSYTLARPQRRAFALARLKATLRLLTGYP